MKDGSSNLTDERAARARLILGDGEVSDDEIRLLRADIFADGVVERADAELVFHLDRHGALKGFAWERFYLDSLGAYFLERSRPRGVVSEEDARLLEERLYADGRIQAATEFELLVRICERAVSVPERLRVLTLHALKETVISGGGPKFGPNRRRRGVVDDADVDAMRRIVYGTGGDDGPAVSRPEAEALFEINDAVKAARNSSQWQDFFVKAVAAHLWNPGGGTGAGGFLRVGATEAAWLASRIAGDGTVHESEKALLAYVKAQSDELDPALAPLYRNAGLPF